MLSGIGGAMSHRSGDYGRSMEFASLSVAGLLVVLASILGIVGGSLALGNKKSSAKYLAVSAIMCGMAFFMSFKDAIVYAVIYVIATICADRGTDHEETDGNHSTANSLSTPSNLSNTFSVLQNSINTLQPQKEKIYEPVLGVETGALIKHALLYLDERDFDGAGRYITQALNQDPENSQAYMIKLMAERKAKSPLELINKLSVPIEEEKLFQRALRFASGEYKSQLEGLVQVSRNMLNQGH